MQAVMLLAGKGRRMRPLTYTRPKPLLKISNETILQHNLSQLKQSGIDDVILVVGYLQDQIKKFLEENNFGINFKFVSQEKQLGTGDALLHAQPFLQENNFLVINGDDYHHKDDIKKCLESDLSVAAKEVSTPSRFGIFVLNNGHVNDLIEKPTEPISNLANAGLYNLNMNIFNLLKNVTVSKRNEIELTDAVKKMATEYSMSCKIIDKWTPIGYPWDLLSVNEIKMNELKNDIDSTSNVEERATIKGIVKIGKDTEIRNGAYIEGPVVIGNNCIIGPNCYIRPFSSVGDDCRIGNSVEIKNSIIGNGTRIEHLSYIGDSIIGEDCNLGAGTITANLRHDNKTIRSKVDGDLVDTGRRKYGVVLGDHTKIGIRTSFYPGVSIGPFSWTFPSSAIKENIEPLSIFDGVNKIPLDESKFSDPEILKKINLVKNGLM